MRRIIKNEPPEFWLEYKKSHADSKYDDLDRTEEGKQFRRSLRKHLLEQQGNLCCYCCREIAKASPSSSHIEHIKPRSLYPKESMNYDNLLVSCENRKTCGTKKGGHYNAETFISPTMEDCEKHFIYTNEGRIVGADVAANDTIEILNLNEGSLVNERKNLLNECFEAAISPGKQYIYDYYIKEKDDVSLPRYVDMVTYFYENGDFDAEVCCL